MSEKVGIKVGGEQFHGAPQDIADAIATIFNAADAARAEQETIRAALRVLSDTAAIGPVSISNATISNL